DTWNVIPNEVVLRGTARTFASDVQDQVEARMRAIVAGVTTALECSAVVDYQRRYPATINTSDETSQCVAAAASVVGPSHVDAQVTPNMGSEDFAFMLQQRPGCYILAGNGPSTGERLLHNPRYDFNDDLLPVGASYWVTVAENYSFKSERVTRTK
ncbi:MAG: M20/M25/M40 family metallo-hydrolase, partial [Pirellulaceae bacterium]